MLYATYKAVLNNNECFTAIATKYMAFAISADKIKQEVSTIELFQSTHGSANISSEVLVKDGTFLSCFS